MKRISDKRQRQLREESEVHRQIWERCKGKCEKCGRPLGFRSSFHEVLFRSRGGKVSLDNTLALCGGCHDACHGIQNLVK